MERVVFGRSPQSTKNRLSGSHKWDILRTFYHQAVEAFGLSIECEESNDEETIMGTCEFTKAKETYLCSEYHKCHAIKHSDYILCILYTSMIPTHTMRLISQKILKTMFSDKQGYW